MMKFNVNRSTYPAVANGDDDDEESPPSKMFDINRELFYTPESSTQPSDDSDPFFPEASVHQPHSIISFDLNSIDQNQPNSIISMPWPFSNSNNVSDSESSLLMTFNLTSRVSLADDDMPLIQPYAASSDSAWSMASSWSLLNNDSLSQYTLSPSAAADDETAAPPALPSEDEQQQFSVLPYDWAHAPEQIVFIGFLLCALTVLTVLGNVYVITAVMIVRRLRRPDNLLIVSLATADLLVGLIDMPFAVVYQLKGRWIFSKIVCDLWISFDVLVCTASILNLCMISIDRYLAISRPLHYGIQGRTKRKMALYIACVWCVAILISIPPLFFFGGNEYIANEKCGYSQSIAYQLYATLGAFYIPLLTTLIVYAQVYRLASRVARAERRSLGTAHVTPATTNLPPSLQLHASQQLANGTHVRSSSTTTSSQQPSRRWFSIHGKWCFRHSSATQQETASKQKRLSSQSSSSTPPVSTSPNDSHDASSSNNIMMRSTVLTTSTANNTANGFSQPNNHHFASTTTTKTSTHSPPLLRINRNYSRTSAGGGGGRGESHKFIKRERKAMRTLSAITAAFVMCWLPFFILALLDPLCSDCRIPPWLSATTLWLGYCNSFINPFLYAYFNRDFRTPFRAIMCCQCHKLHDELRVEQFRAQYGSNATANAASAMGAASTALVAERGGDTTSTRRSLSSVRAQHHYQHHYRGSKDTIQTSGGGSQNGSFRHQRHAVLEHLRNGLGSGVNSTTTNTGHTTPIELLSRPTSAATTSWMLAHDSRRASNEKSSEMSQLQLLQKNQQQQLSSVAMTDEKPSAAGLEPVSAESPEEQSANRKQKRSKHRKHRHRTNTNDSATNTDITGVMIESFVANKLHKTEREQHVCASGHEAIVLYDDCRDEDGVSRDSESSSRKSSRRTSSSHRRESWDETL